MNLLLEIKSTIAKSTIIDVLLISFVLTDEVCVSGKHIYLFVILMLIKFVFGNDYTIDVSFIWISVILCYVTIMGLRIPNNQENFSICYNLSVSSASLMILQLIKRHKIHLIDIIDKTVMFTTLFSGFYIIMHEYKMIMYRWTDYLQGNCGYRLGISSGINPNVISWLFGILGMFSLSLVIYYNKYVHIWFYIVQMILILFTASKNGILFATIPILYIMLKSLKKLNLIKILFFCFLVALLAILIHNNNVLYTLIGKRIDAGLNSIIGNNIILKFTKTSSLDEDSTIKRINMIKYAIDMFIQNPILGWGIGAFAKYSGYGYYSHNNYMELLVSGGVVGFVLYYSYLVYIGIKIIFLNNTKNKILGLIVLLFVLLSDCGTVNFYSRLCFMLPKIVLFLIAENNGQDFNSIFSKLMIA